MFSGLKAIFLERFKPSAYGPMILVFTLMNGLYFARVHHLAIGAEGVIISLLLMASAFFRLRLFDEIKDYEVDLKINPGRPLARGVISIDQTRLTIAFLILFELILSSLLGVYGFLVHVAALVFSLLMFEEFFVGRWLRPHLTIYAITHTFVSVLFAISAAVQLTRYNQIGLTQKDLLFFLSNWFYFNLFEFSRKSYASTEERKGVDTYSSLFGTKGAGILSLSQAILGVGYCFLWPHGFSQIGAISIFIIYVLFTVNYMLSPNNKSASLFRNVSGVYLILQYIINIWFYWR
jgi:4-hydroxybenzoate polyprenyltransferase